MRLTSAFALAMAVVLAAVGLFLYLRLESELGRTLDDGLRARADDVAVLVRRSDSGLGDGGGLSERGESFAQVLDATGAVVDTTPVLGKRPLLSRPEVARALRRPIFLERRGRPGLEAARILAAPVEVEDRRLIVVVGASTDGRDEALASLLTQLLVGGPAALVLASLLAYTLAAAALRPVEAMRSRAAAITASEPGRRLPVPEAEDEVSRLGRTLNEMLGRLETALEHERTFVADASHELRTPLALLKTELELALRHPRSAAELEEALRSATEETDRLAQLAEDLLVLARSDQDGLALRVVRIGARELLDGVAERFAARARRSGRPVRVQADPELVLAVDRARVEQALSNLVDNAFRHGGGEIRLTAVARDGTVELHVLDHGSGFPPGFGDRAFDRFSRADEARSGGGAGLGLAIASVIARAHGGSAEAATREQPPGADVWLTIPASLIDLPRRKALEGMTPAASGADARGSTDEFSAAPPS